MKVKDLMNHMVPNGTIDTVVMYHKLTPVVSLPFPKCMDIKGHEYRQYENDRLYSFTIRGNVLRVDVEHAACEDPEQAKIVVTYSYPLLNGKTSMKSRRCLTQTQADYVCNMIRRREGAEVISVVGGM